jgi:hypothetical protein
MISKNDVLTYFLTYFCQKSGCVTTPCQQPLPLSFTVVTAQPKGGRNLAGLWFALRNGASQNTNRFPVPGCGECGGWQVFSRAGLLLFPSGSLVPHRSGQVPETGRLYAVTHHTSNTLHIPRSSYLDLVVLLLLVRKWGPTLPYPVCDVPPVHYGKIMELEPLGGPDSRRKSLHFHSRFLGTRSDLWGSS